MPNLTLAQLTDEIQANVRSALREDIGSGDITAQLIPAERQARAQLITREAAVISGCAWVDEVFRQIDPTVVWSGWSRTASRYSPTSHCSVSAGQPEPFSVASVRH